MSDWTFCPYCKDDEDKLLNEGCCYCENTGKIRKSEYPDSEYENKNQEEWEEEQADWERRCEELL